MSRGSSFTSAFAASLVLLGISTGCGYGGSLKRLQCSVSRQITTFTHLLNGSETAAQGLSLTNAAWNSTKGGYMLSRPTPKALPNLGSAADWFSMTSNLLLFHFEEANGSTVFANSSGVAGLDGSCAGGTCPNGTNTLVGPLSRFLTFDGVDDFVTVPYTAAMQLSGDVSVSMWVMPERRTRNDYNEIMTLLSRGVNGDDNYNVYFSAGLYSFSHWDTGSVLRTYAGTIPAVTYGKWQLVTVVFDDTANQVRFYKNGVLLDTIVSAHSLRSSQVNAIQLGRSSTGASPYYFRGDMDEVAIWNRALSTVEVQNLYAESSKAASLTGSVELPADDVNCAEFTRLGYEPVSPANKPLPSGGASSSVIESYTEGGVSMANNLLLMHFEETSIVNGTTIADSSGAGRHGTYIADDAVNKSVADGITGRAIRFDGTTDILQVPNAVGTYAAITISIWFRKAVTGANASYSLFNWGFPNTSPQSLQLVLCDSGFGGFANYIVQRWSDNVQSDVDLQMQAYSARSMGDGNWHHWVTTKNASGHQTYLDGRRVMTSTDVSGNFIPYIDIYLGGRWDGAAFVPSRAYSGDLDEVAIWGRSLSAAEVFDLYRRAVTKVSLQYRYCTDFGCQTAGGFAGPSGSNSEKLDISGETTASAISQIGLTNTQTPARLLQTKAYLETTDFLLEPGIKSLNHSR